MSIVSSKDGSRTDVIMYKNNGLLVLVMVKTHSHTMTPFDAPGKQAFENAHNEQFAISPFPTVFSTCLDNFLPFSSNLKLSSANPFSLEE